jgi:Cu+-exporting ATPase
VACPCALALAAPVALGTAQRVLARRGVFLKNPYVLETLAEVDAVVFDKTGTLTAAGAGNVTWRGAALNDQEKNQIWSLARQSTHPLAVRVAQFVAGAPGAESRSFREIPGCGVEAVVDGAEIWMGSATWLETRGVKPAAKIETDSTRSAVHVASGGNYRGVFELTGGLRPGVERAVREFSKDCELTLLSGDHAREQKIFSGVFGSDAELRFQQTPVDKLDFIRQLQARGRKVMMVGDGLNDAGALKQSDAGVAVVEDSGVLSPASDVILTAAMMPQLPAVRAYARRAVRVVRVAFVISSLYNLLGVSIAASGRLAPVVCAVLMPLSSVTVVAFASLAAAWTGRRLKSQS